MFVVSAFQWLGLPIFDTRWNIVSLLGLTEVWTCESWKGWWKVSRFGMFRAVCIVFCSRCTWPKASWSSAYVHLFISIFFILVKERESTGLFWKKKAHAHAIPMPSGLLKKESWTKSPTTNWSSSCSWEKGNGRTLESAKAHKHMNFIELPFAPPAPETCKNRCHSLSL